MPQPDSTKQIHGGVITPSTSVIMATKFVKMLYSLVEILLRIVWLASVARITNSHQAANELNSK
jgi:hypothetical protein